MRRLSKEQSRRRWAQIRNIICEWDPIGVMDDPDWPRDEYDCLLGPLLRRLEQGQPEQEVAAYLEAEIRDHFGLDPSYYDFGAIASRLSEWYRESWKDTVS